MPNNALKTPFYLLLTKQSDLEDSKELVDFFLENCEIDFHTYRGQEMAKMMSTQNADHQIPKPSRVINFQYMMTLLDNRKELEFDVYFKAFREVAGDAIDDYCLRFLEISVANGKARTSTKKATSVRRRSMRFRATF